MQEEKRSLKSRISFGLIILLPLTIALFSAIKILKIFGEISSEIFWKYFYPNIFWLIAAFSGLLVYLLIALLIDVIYHSNKTWLSDIIDNFVLSIPYAKYFWHAKRFRHENRMLDFSKMRAVLVDLHDGVWDLVFITGTQKFRGGKNLNLVEVFILSRDQVKNGEKPVVIMARGVNLTVPVPVTGFFHFIDEERLRQKSRILYSEKPASELLEIYISGGFIGPEELMLTEN